MKRVLVDSVQKHDRLSNANLPKLVSFASGDDIPPTAKFANYRNLEDGSHVLTAETSRLSYVNKAPPEDLMLAVVDRTAGTARLLPLQSFHLSPALVPADAPEEDEARPTAEDLGRAFGLARWQKMYNRSQRLSVRSGADSVAQALTVVADHVAAPDEVDDAGEAVSAGLVPPQDRAATHRSAVYQREDVLPRAIRARLPASDDEFREALAKHASTTEYIVKYSAMFENSDEERYYLVVYGFYMLRMLRYLQTMKLKMSWKSLMVPGPILQHLRESFMEQSHHGWARSDRLVDKLVCYFLVLALWIHDYTLDLQEMAAATRIQHKKLLQYSSALGLTVTGRTAVLKLPLKLRPAENRRRSNKVASL